MFSNFDEYMKENDANQQVVILVQKHLGSLTEFFARYYLKNEDPRHDNMWIIDPFAEKFQNASKRKPHRPIIRQSSQI
ncbi:dimer_Tnp_hAT domain-containing protein [Trichonephila clavipes]|nr:dimer_Tnp_hAT domain-containing protein [Trichonephila clavipes]